MDGKKKTIILIALFVILMAGASFLYSSLSRDYKLDSLVVENETNNSSKEDSQNSESISSEPDSSDNNDTSSSGNASSESADSKEETHDSTSSQENQTQTAPDFTVYDFEGNQVKLSDYFGKPIIINFWASWCGPCQMEMPDFDAAYANYKNDIEFLMINMTDGSRETVEIASSFINEKGYSFPVYYDNDYNATITYSVTSLPTTYFLNSNGELAAHAKGAIDAATLQKGIDMIYTVE